jgi:DNA-binding response OmpR family regulator
MKVYNFAPVVVALLGFSQGTRLSIRDGLLNNGLRRLHDASSVEQIRRVIVGVEPDLTFLHIDPDPETVGAIVTDMRHGRLGNNPYAVVVGVTWRPERAIVNRAVHAGMDDLITLPISAGALFERIDLLVERRNEFVVTTDYVGPDRRVGRRPATDDLGTFPVPNVLRQKLSGESKGAIDPAVIDTVNKTVAYHRLCRLTTRLGQLAAQHEQTAERRGVDAVPNDALKEMNGLLARITNALEADGYEHLLELAYSMQDAIRKVRRLDQPTIKIFKLLKLHGQAVTAAVKSSADASEMVLTALGMALEFTQAPAMSDQPSAATA